MKTLLLSEIFPPETGGSGRWFWEIYRRMPRHQFAIVAGQQTGAAEFDRTHDLNVVRAPLSFGDWGLASPAAWRAYWRAFQVVRKVVRSEGVSQIHCGRCVPEGWIAWMLKSLYGIPYVCYVHGEDANAASSGASEGVLSSRQLRWMTGRVLRSTQAVIANSRNSARIVQEQWAVPAEHTHVLHPGVDTDYFVPAGRDAQVRAQLGWQERPVILTAGRLHRRKGQDMMIRALSTIREAIPDVLFAIVGDGHELGYLKQLTQDENQQGHVLFMGNVSDEVLKQAYQQADLFVLPNRQIGTDIEGFGMVLLEAQACGTPVVAGASGGTAETMSIPETGQVVPCDGPDDLASLVVQLLLDPACLARMGHAARDWVVGNFEWNALSGQAARAFGCQSLSDAECRVTERSRNDSEILV